MGLPFENIPPGDLRRLLENGGKVIGPPPQGVPITDQRLLYMASYTFGEILLPNGQVQFALHIDTPHAPGVARVTLPIADAETADAFLAAMTHARDKFFQSEPAA